MENIYSFRALIDNPAFVIPALSWLIAQSLKVMIVVLIDKKLDFSRLMGAGGMPSSHSAYVCSLAAVLAKNHGLGSSLFAISIVFALVVMADAAGVRRAAGKQAEVLNKLINHTNTFKIEVELKELLGHTPFQVYIGAFIGILIGIIFG